MKKLEITYTDFELTFKCDWCHRIDEHKTVSINLDGWEHTGLEDNLSSLTYGNGSTVSMKCPACVYEASKEAKLQNAQRLNTELMNKGVSITERINILSRDFPDLSFDLEIS